MTHTESHQILENWRIKRILDAKSVENAIATLENRKERYGNSLRAAGWLLRAMQYTTGDNKSARF
jgi:hypothetical protein